MTRHSKTYGQWNFITAVFTALIILPVTMAAQTKAVAVTFDDLPFVQERSLQNAVESTHRLLRTLKENKVPAVGFVNESKLYTDGHAKQRTLLLEKWLMNGHELGNHTYSHLSFNNVSLQEYERDVLRGDSVTRLLATKYSVKLRYFRYPFLQTGPDSISKYSFAGFLEAHGYQSAPVTVDNEDYIFNKVYVNALIRKDTAQMKLLTTAYLAYVDSMFAFFERQAILLEKRPIHHILICHANQINADHFQQVIDHIKTRGYTFITLEEALKDPVYKSEERYVGKGGFSWLHRWRRTRQIKLAEPEPEIPISIQQHYDEPSAR